MNSIRIGNVVHGGQDPSNGITFIIDSAVVVGDVVTADTSVANKAIRGADGALPIGLVTNIDGDQLGRVQSFEEVTVIKLTGSVILGPAGLQGKGDGSGKLVAAGTSGSLLVNVVGSQTINSVVYVALNRL